LTSTVLHPSLRSHWFAATADQTDERAQTEAIETAEVIFKFVAESYLETSTPTVAAEPCNQDPRPVMKTTSFLASACSFRRPTFATTTNTISERTPEDELRDELARYLRFEAAPMERQEAEMRLNEPSADEVLLNPLLWWKVCH
jgi:hypothetical protein